MNLTRVFLLLTVATASLWGRGSSGIYLKGRAIVEAEDVYLSSVARIPEGYEDRVLLKNPKKPTYVGAREIADVYRDLDPIVTGKETLVLPLNHTLDPAEIAASLSEEISKKHPQEEFRLTYISGETKVPREGVELRWANLSSRLHPGQVMASLEIYFQNQKVHSLRIRF
ncbi:endoflagellar basal body P-ring biosynthesis protein, partial [Leptospira ellisii]